MAHHRDEVRVTVSYYFQYCSNGLSLSHLAAGVKSVVSDKTNITHPVNDFTPAAR
jgi:hypothetical protein